MTERIRVFADSNIIFSASHQSPNQFEAYWSIPTVDILTSQYSIAEVSRNLKTSEQRARLWQLIYKSHLVPEGDLVVLPADISLPAKDEPILRAAIAGQAGMLVTGDVRHFGAYYGQRFSDVLIVSPGAFRRQFAAHFRSEAK